MTTVTVDILRKRERGALLIGLQLGAAIGVLVTLFLR